MSSTPSSASAEAAAAAVSTEGSARRLLEMKDEAGVAYEVRGPMKLWEGTKKLGRSGLPHPSWWAQGLRDIPGVHLC